jgi:hypothetical protein
MFSDFFKSQRQTYQEEITEIQLIPSTKLLIVGVVLMDQNPGLKVNTNYELVMKS